MSLKRIKKELEGLENESNDLFTVQPANNNLHQWDATLSGPANSPYEGGKFKIKINFPPAYPYQPPKVKFLTRIYHPNISENGMICLDILRSQWSPALTVSKLLLSIASLLCDPNVDDPIEPEIAKVWKKNQTRYTETARKWTLKYAK